MIQIGFEYKGQNNILYLRGGDQLIVDHTNKQIIIQDGDALIVSLSKDKESIQEAIDSLKVIANYLENNLK